MTDMARLGLSGMAAASHSYAAQRQEKPKVTAGQVLQLGLAGASLGKTIGKDIAIRKGIVKPATTMAHKLETAETAKAGMQRVPGKDIGITPEQGGKIGAGTGTILGIMSGLF